MADHRNLIEEIERAVSDDTFNLTEWEDGFITGLKARLDAGDALTNRQDEVLEGIWRRATR